MTIIEEIRRDREDLARVLKKHRGIRKLVEDLYPDKAHFIYELLQNAEDACAREVNFSLDSSFLLFEHDGRPFDHKDISKITEIGNETEESNEDRIGRFGVGFKAVFAYSETPSIWSPTYSFKIYDLVLPMEIDPFPDLASKTRFRFPFDNPKKEPVAAFAEVEFGLTDLAETTLLFLRHLESISWDIPDVASGSVERIRHSENHVEVRKQVGGQTPTSLHFLKFDQPVVGLQNRCVAVAFVLDVLPNVQAFDPAKPLAKQFKITSANPGRVAVYFPAEKETSGLRFHLHAPFVPELSRASIKETPANQPLFKQLAALTAVALPRIRDLGLLTTDFLAVLPNPQDAVPPRYEPIRKAIVEAMNTEPLTPTHARSHEPAKRLLQARASLKDLLSAEDLKFLVDFEEAPPLWAIAAQQKNSNADRFLEGLAIRKWDTEQFVDSLIEKTSDKCRYSSRSSKYLGASDNDFMAWLSTRPIEWHQKLYALLNEYLSFLGGRKDAVRNELQQSRLIRLVNGEYGTGSKCFFPSGEGKDEDGLPRVDRGAFTSGKSKPEQESARKFLEEIGVRDVGEAERVEAILKQRYASAEVQSRKDDLERFIALVEKSPDKAGLFREYFVLKGEGGRWRKPRNIFLDQPFMDTGLSAYYDALAASRNQGDEETGEDDDSYDKLGTVEPERIPLASSYETCRIPLEKIATFANAVGAQMRLEIKQTSCSNNADWSHLCSVGGQRYRNYIDRDYTIDGLSGLLRNPSLALSKLIWRTMSAPDIDRFLQAAYQKNERYGPRHADSQLVHHLHNAAWVPQNEGTGVSFVRPADAVPDLLPEGFPFDRGSKGLSAMQFGRNVTARSQQQRESAKIAKQQLGINDDAGLERARRFVALDPEKQERILADNERPQSKELPDNEPDNPQRRAERVQGEAKSAPLKESELRTRSVSIDIDAVKANAEPYLREQYTNADHEMFCQICETVLPFKLDNDSYYFEKVEFLTELTKRHHQNYLALCPNHAAMFQHANGSRDTLMENFTDLADNRLPVVLAQQETTIYFTKTHIADLKAVIETEEEAVGESAETD